MHHNTTLVEAIRGLTREVNDLNDTLKFVHYSDCMLGDVLEQSERMTLRIECVANIAALKRTK